MKQVQKTIGRWVQRIAGKNRVQRLARPAGQPVELDAQSLRQIGGGNSLPFKGW